MNSRLITGVAIAAVALFAVAWAASPLLAVRGLIDAGQRGDEAALEQRVDFPAFRDSVKEELNAQMRAEMRNELSGQDSALSGLGMMLAPALVAGAVDTFVTPSAIAAMVQNAEAPAARREPQPAKPAEPDSDIRQSYSYRGLNTFAVTLTDPDRPAQSLDLLLERRGLFGWKLAGLDLPEREKA